jgi:hypothetical protein
MKKRSRGREVLYCPQWRLNEKLRETKRNRKMKEAMEAIQEQMNGRQDDMKAQMT